MKVLFEVKKCIVNKLLLEILENSYSQKLFLFLEFALTKCLYCKKMLIIIGLVNVGPGS